MVTSQQIYPTDLNDTQWLKIRPYLPAEAQTGRPREHSWRTILNGIFYILQSGCSWRMLPTNLPSWQTVYHYFRLWRKEGLWERLNQALREKYADNDIRKSLNRVLWSPGWKKSLVGS
jgi:putative transposase